MRVTRRLRRFSVWIAILGLLSMQVAVAGYACPVDPLPMADSSMADCGSMPDIDQPSLCKAHSEAQSQLNGDTIAISIVAAPVQIVIGLLPFDSLKDGDTARLNSYESTRLEPDGSPPLFLRLLVLLT
jgi:hypothetical protein